MNNKLKKNLNIFLRNFFKQNNNFFTLENTDKWDSLAHFKLILSLQKKFSVNFKNSEIVNLTDEKKILNLLKKKIK